MSSHTDHNYPVGRRANEAGSVSLGPGFPLRVWGRRMACSWAPAIRLCNVEGGGELKEHIPTWNRGLSNRVQEPSPHSGHKDTHSRGAALTTTVVQTAQGPQLRRGTASYPHPERLKPLQLTRTAPGREDTRPIRCRTWHTANNGMAMVSICKILDLT